MNKYLISVLFIVLLLKQRFAEHCIIKNKIVYFGNDSCISYGHLGLDIIIILSISIIVILIFFYIKKKEYFTFHFILKIIKALLIFFYKSLSRMLVKNKKNYYSNEIGGNIYIFTCPRWGASIKIGKTNNLNRRLEEAQEEVKGTYSPRPPKVEIFFSQFSDKYSELETLVHSKLDAYRVEHSGKGREFFDIAPEEARRVIIEASKELE